MSIREQFEKDFGKKQANAVMAAAEYHKNGVHDKMGSDPFRWAIAICLGYQCMEKDRFREYHGITIPWETVKEWIKVHGDLKNHDGDSDYLSLLCGVYNEFVKETVQ